MDNRKRRIALCNELRDLRRETIIEINKVKARSKYLQEHYPNHFHHLTMTLDTHLQNLCRDRDQLSEMVYKECGL